MHEGKLVLRSPGERNRLPPRVPLGKRPSQLRPSHRAPGEHVPRMLCELGEIDPFKLPPKRGKPEIPHTPGQERPHPEIVRGNTEMLGTAQQPPADNAPIMQRLNQLCMPKLI